MEEEARSYMGASLGFPLIMHLIRPSFPPLLDLGQELLASSGKICQKAPARVANECWQADFCEGHGKKQTGDSEASSQWPGATPRSPKGFWRDTNAQNGVAPGHKMFFAGFDFGLLTTVLGRFSRPWLMRL